jgi:hypothetical protein
MITVSAIQYSRPARPDLNPESLEYDAEYSPLDHSVSFFFTETLGNAKLSRNGCEEMLKDLLFRK